MGWTRATVYPSTSSFSGAGQLNLGPYYIPSPAALLRVEVHGKANFQGATIASNGVEANYPLWGVQWVTHGSSPQDVVSSADDEHWLLREQLGSDETRFAWEPTSSNAAYLNLLNRGFLGRPDTARV